MIVKGRELWAGDVLLTRYPAKYSWKTLRWWLFKIALYKFQKIRYPKSARPKSLWETHARIFDTRSEWYSGTYPKAIKESFNPETLDCPWVIVRYKFQEDWGPKQLAALQKVIDENVGKPYDIPQLAGIAAQILFHGILPESWRIDGGTEKRVCSVWVLMFLVHVWKTTLRKYIRPLLGMNVELCAPADFENWLSVFPDGHQELTFEVVAEG